VATRNEELRIKIRLDDTGKLTADLGGVQKQLGAVGAAGKQAGGGLQAFASPVMALRSALPALGLAGAATGLVALTKGALGTAGALSDVADRTGVGAESIQELNFAADQAGVSAGGMERALEGFAKRVGEARSGTGSLVTALKDQDAALLANVQSAGSTEEALDLVFRKIAETTNAADRAAIANAAFGRSGIELLPMLSQGTAGLEAMRQRARDLGIVMSNEMVQAGDAAGDRLAELGTVIKGNLNRALVEAAPLIESAATKLTELAVAAAKVGPSIGRDIADNLESYVGFAALTLAPAHPILALATLGGLVGKNIAELASGMHDAKTASEAAAVVGKALAVALEEVNKAGGAQAILLPELTDQLAAAKAEFGFVAKAGGDTAPILERIRDLQRQVAEASGEAADGLGTLKDAAGRTVVSLKELSSLKFIDRQKLAGQVGEAVKILETLDGVQIRYDEKFLRKNRGEILEIIKETPELIPEDVREIVLKLLVDDTSVEESLEHVRGEISAFRRDAEQGITFPVRADVSEARRSILDVFDEINAKAEGLLLFGGRGRRNTLNEVTGLGQGGEFAFPDPKAARRELAEVLSSGDERALESFISSLSEIVAGFGGGGDGSFTRRLSITNPWARFVRSGQSQLTQILREAEVAAGGGIPSTNAVPLSATRVLIGPTPSASMVNFAPLERESRQSNQHLAKIAGGFTNLENRLSAVQRATEIEATETRSLRTAISTGTAATYAAGVIGAGARMGSGRTGWR
jgi:hypothetical protein